MIFNAETDGPPVSSCCCRFRERSVFHAYKNRPDSVFHTYKNRSPIFSVETSATTTTTTTTTINGQDGNIAPEFSSSVTEGYLPPECRSVWTIDTYGAPAYGFTDKNADRNRISAYFLERYEISTIDTYDNPESGFNNNFLSGYFLERDKISSILSLQLPEAASRHLFFFFI